MSVLETIKKEIINKINQALGKDLVQVSDLVYPPNSEMGDLSLPVFKVAKEVKQNPNEVVKLLIEKVKDEKNIKTVKAVGPYFNIILNYSILNQQILTEVQKQKDKYGFSLESKKKRIMIEFTNANTHKEYHVGHLRNLCYGDSVSRMLAANGYTSIPVSYINDFGIHAAKTLWAYLTFYQSAELPKNKGRFLGEVYVRASQEAEKDKTAKDLIEVMMKKIESRKGAEYKLWQKTRKWSIEQFEQIYKELGIKLEKVFYESEVIEQGLKEVDELMKKGILKESQGAVIADLEKYNLGVLMFKRTDGTALYPVADLALAKIKFKKYKLDSSIYVVDVRQSLHFKQLFKVLELMGYKQDMIHLGYDVVKLPSGMMSSRSGNVITYEQLQEQLFAKAQTETKTRHQDWSEEKINKVARGITIGTIKFEMIKVAANQIITFDIDKALSFSGFTAAYLQYSVARINSLIRKAEVSARQLLKADGGKLSEVDEQQLIMKMAKYPEIVARASNNYDPSEIAKYLFELAQAFNDYYHKVPILKSEPELKLARLALIKDLSQVIINGLNLLGIQVLDEM